MTRPACRPLRTLRALPWLLMLASAAAVHAQDSLPPAVTAALARAGVPEAALGAVALPLGHRGAAWQHRADVPMQPGSAMKLVTAVVALDRLGATHAGRTRLLSSAPQQGGVLRGDVALQGGADPDFGAARLWQMLMGLRDAGITHIEGDLLLDRQRYRPARFDLGLPPFDERPEGWWNVIPDALLFDGGLQTYRLDARDAAFAARLAPRLAGVQIDTQALALNTLACADWDEAWRTPVVTEEAAGVRITLQGAFPRGCARTESMQLVDRTRLIGLWFAQIWRELGGQWSGQVREAAAPADARVLAEERGRPWGEVLRPLVKTSDNTWARLLFLELGVPGMAAAPQATTQALARAVVQDWFAEKGIAAPGLVMDNGSGLSRSERITPQAMAELLRWAWHSRHASDLLATLPVAGVDGTLRSRLKDSPATGVARLKTGTLRNVAALAGIVNDPHGRPWAVVAFVNHDIGSGARPVLDTLIDDFARHGPYRPLPPLFMGPTGG
jgi:serine-type D-Ala-D-Ala carboxypeptidase/endopeptidase (penicillin-binding protein 4)